MDESSVKKEPGKRRFAPKAPPKREKKQLVLPKAEKYENDADGALAEKLLQKLNETKGRPKSERTSGPAQVAFGLPGASSTSIRSYAAGKNRNLGSSDGGAGHALEKEYKEPWDYYTNYPVTLPLRRPYSGNPELLDKEEFEGHQGASDCDDNGTNLAADLGLMEDYPINDLIFLQFPRGGMPMEKDVKDKESDKKPIKEGKDKDSDKKPIKEGKDKDKDKDIEKKPIKRPLIKFEELPKGHIGKLLVHRNGAVKLKIGDTCYDVSGGIAGTFSQDVVAINTAARDCTILGELTKRSVVTPGIDSIIDTMSGL